MVILPSSPTSLFAETPHNIAYVIVSQLPTPSTPDNEDSDTTTPQIASGSHLTSMFMPAKRDYKSHVPSACINCKKAHLACDVSRPCKRCVSGNKGESCQDVKHKKRGRPRLNETNKVNSSRYGSSMGFEDRGGSYSTLQTATFTMTTSVVHRKPPSPPKTISFIHEPVETFREGERRASRKKDGSFVSSLNPQGLRDSEPPPSSFLLGSLDPISSSNHHLEDGIITMFLSMDMCCARASDEVAVLWGYSPQDLVHRSLYGLISSHDKNRLNRLHRLLLDNITDSACQDDNAPTAEDTQPVPNAQRTISPIFYETNPARLTLTAQGSSTYSDTLHFKKLSGGHELYEVAVYLGGGLGADLMVPSTLDQLYIVAEMKKHQYKVTSFGGRGSSFASWSPPASTLNRPPQSSSSFSSSSPGVVVHGSKNSTTTTITTASSSGSKHSVPRRVFKPIAPYFGGRFGPHQVRQGTLPGHFTANSQLNTVSLPPKSVAIPKFNIARSSSSSSPTAATQKQPDKRVADRLFSSHSSGSSGSGGSSGGASGASGGLYFRRIAATSPSPITSIGHNPYSTLAYRTAPPTHPAMQYFLQTSSSTLNAAESAAQGSTRKWGRVVSMADNDRAVGKTDANRKAEMSIRSLLC